MKQIRRICRTAAQRTHAAARGQGLSPEIAQHVARRQIKQLYAHLIRRYRAAQVHRARAALERSTSRRDARWARN